MSRFRIYFAQINDTFTVIPTIVLVRKKFPVADEQAIITATAAEAKWMWFSAILVYTTVNPEPDTVDESPSE